MKKSSDAPGADHNPLADDVALFDMYMHALTEVLGKDEIRSALDEIGVSTNQLRHILVSDARQVLALAPEEFAAYEAARTSTVDDGDLDSVMRWAGRTLLVLGAALIAGGLATVWWWSWGWILFWAGGTTLVAAGVAFGVLRLRRLRLGRRVFQGDLAPGAGSERDALIKRLARYELLGQVRTRINLLRAYRFDRAFGVTSSPGLSEIHDSLYEVPTRAAVEVDSLITNVTGISLGIAGPRGSGKSTIIAHYCGTPPREQERLKARNVPLTESPPATSLADVRCLVLAPVDYAARDFVLHLFTVFCRRVISVFGPVARQRPWQRWLIVPSSMAAVASAAAPRVIVIVLAVAALLLVALNPWTIGVAVLVGSICAVRFAYGVGRLVRRAGVAPRTFAHQARSLLRDAQRNLVRVRHLQSHSTGWSGALRLPVGAEGQLSGGVTRAEQPLSHPEVVEEFRGFARRVSALVHAYGGRVFVGVDELDKIGSAEQAERFLNELKGVLGIPHVYFLVSVSDDALVSFERRGIPLRDAFDSSFDEIVRVGRLTYPESRRLLYRRVIGLSEPYIGLCHVLSGGIARDLIRAARRVVQIGTALAARPAGLVSWDETVLEADRFVVMAQEETPPVPVELVTVSAAIVQEEISRKALAFTHALADVRATGDFAFQQILYDARMAGSPKDLMDALLRPCDGEPPEMTRLHVDYAAYVYFCLTVGEVFNASLDDNRLERCTGTPAWEGGFDALAAARAAFVTDSRIAWRAISGIRRAWQLDVKDLTM
ncbi:hypothetical protein Nocox_20605 [Nonomuraea coxensis DSM 45129]|uniref:KAP NTPase domain-containing protein n=1 Tax=Nonomuraea coxensis DSM 45129 TaxID=1122611 RepID=A0ABX8U4R1_9ACTN|nr:hypothetical protein [Nonomuraea coxensis]QYC41729.1 hypothetical protein Nocox_20605 [Nonomuraea coxensis DSM 45129]